MYTIENKTFDEIRIGDSRTLTRTLTKEDIDIFAVASGDMNPTHFGVGVSGGKPLGHGMWIGVLLSNIFGSKLPGAGAVYKSQNLLFHKMVELGETLTLTVTVTGKNEKDKTIQFDCLCTNQDGVTLATGTAEIFAPKEKIEPQVLPPRMARISRQHWVFDALIDRCQEIDPVTVAVCHPCDRVSLEGAVQAAERGLIRPILVGPEADIKAAAEKNDLDIKGYEILSTNHAVASAEQAVALCRAGKAEALMKGSLHTDEMMHAVAQRETGLRTGRRISHVFIMDVPAYDRMLLITDAAINIYPSLDDKVDIVKNAIDLAQVLEVAEPKIAILSAVETVYPKIASTLEAAALCKMADRGQIKGAILDGPLAFDNAISAEAAEIKGIKSQVAGKADIMLVPDLEAGNMLAKQLAYLANAEMAGIVLGARVPIILTSRADSARARLASSAAAVLLAHARRVGSQKKMTGGGH